MLKTVSWIRCEAERRTSIISSPRSLIDAFAISVSMLLLSPVMSRAQSQPICRLTGSVRSSDNSRPLVGVTIRVAGTALGTTTNSEGRYRLLLRKGEHVLRFSYIGFDPDTIPVRIAVNDTTISVLLHQSEVPLPEVIVYPQSSNAADEIVRRAIAAKKKWRPKLDSYDLNAYTKTVLRVDTGKTESEEMIAGILETQTIGYWKSPDFYREVVTAKRQTANFSSEENIFTPGKVLNFNDDIVKIGRYSIAGPISSEAFRHYKFSILDTIWQGATRTFRLAIEPKESASPLFRGIIDIEDGSFALVHTRLTLSDPTALDPIRNVVYDEQFSEYDDVYWLPVRIATTFTVKFTLTPVPPVSVHNTSVLYDYRINPRFPSGFFSRDFAASSPPVANTDSSAWMNEQILPLTHAEVLAYAALDSLARAMPFYLKAIVFLTTRLPERVASWPITSFSDFYHFNRVEGSYLGVGFKSSSILRKTELTAIAGYGFSDRMWKYDFGASYELPFANNLTVGASLFKRLANREEEDIYSRLDVTLGALLYRDDYRDYYLSKGCRTFLKWQLNSSVVAGLAYADEVQTSVKRNTGYSLFSQRYDYSVNPPIDEGRVRSIVVSLGLDTRRYSGTGMSLQSDQGSGYWNCNAYIEMSSPRFLNSSFSFTRYHVGLMRHQMTFASGYLDLWAIGNFCEKGLPVQRKFEIQASYGGYGEQQVLSTLDTRRILSDRTIVVGIEHNFPHNIFRSSRIPVVKNVWFDLTLYAHGAAAAGLSPMGEVGFGLVNLIPLIRTDFTWGVAGHCKGFAWTLGTTLGF